MSWLTRGAHVQPLKRPRARRVSLRSLVVRSLTSHLTREGLRNPRAPRQNEAHVSAIRGHGTGRRPRGAARGRGDAPGSARRPGRPGFTGPTPHLDRR